MERLEAGQLSPRACKSIQALRRRPDATAAGDFRLNFALDSDRVLHSLAYTRYIDKTQVFSLLDNEHITHRVLHVQLVSKIARGAGRVLNLNQDLLEAISLAHDIGHPPFGHEGEGYLSLKCQEHGLGFFQHNLAGVNALERLEKQGRGLNLSLQVLDGVLGHDGEALLEDLLPGADRSFSQFDDLLARKAFDARLKIVPMTLEGCLVRLADSVAYAGRDMEDAILLGLIKREELPAPVKEVLGQSNGTIVYRLVSDLIAHSLEQEGIGFSPPVRRALLLLKDFNRARIYKNPLVCAQHHKIKDLFARLFDALLADARRENKNSIIYKDFLDNMGDAYLDASTPPMRVRDFMAGMTDSYFIRACRDLFMPARLPRSFADTV
ncbi:MAG: HD domain-containing protein [Desulfarculales bacterium]|nr:HD domain-containing protein [Desulfarculales bacterium]